ncbi:MAG: EI24 domain-containing protein [Myxococcales bacterium]
MIARPPVLTPSNPVVELGRGFVLPFRALSIMFSTPRLLRLTSAVAALTVASLAVLVWALVQVTPGLVALIWKPPAEWWLGWLHTLLTVFVFLLLLVLGANTVPMTLAAPLMDPLSLATERAMGIEVPDTGGLGRLVAEILRAVKNALARLVVLYAGHAILLLLLVIPGGAVVWTWAGWAWTTVWLAAQYLDVPMARHLYRFAEVKRVVRARFFLLFGFGAAIYLLLWIPLLNFFFVPVAVIGSTMLFRGLVGAGTLAPPSDEAPPAALR